MDTKKADSLSYQQMRLLELVDGASREQRDYLVAPVEEADAKHCVDLGYLAIDGRVAKLTDDGHRYIIWLNTGR